jgi:tripartite-type tricarboxylate transporter receptor subunit TctC
MLSRTKLSRAIMRIALALIGTVQLHLDVGAFAQEFPSRAIRVVVPYSAGGPVDIVGRLFMEEARKAFLQPIVIENRPGAATILGTRAVRDAPPDGHTLLVQSPGLLLNAMTEKDQGYQISDFVPIAPIALLGAPVVIVPADFPAESLSDFVALVRSKPGQFNYGTLGGANPITLLSNRFMTTFGLQMVEVPYKGVADAMSAVMGGDIHFAIVSAQLIYAQVESRRLKALAVSSEEADPKLPGVPTFRQLGYPGIMPSAWVAVFARTETPPPILAALRKVMGDVALSSQLYQQLKRVDALPWTDLGPALDRAIKDDTVLWEKDLSRMGLINRK